MTEPSDRSRAEIQRRLGATDAPAGVRRTSQASALPAGVLVLAGQLCGLPRPAVGAGVRFNLNISRYVDTTVVEEVMSVEEALA